MGGLFIPWHGVNVNLFYLYMENWSNINYYKEGVMVPGKAQEGVESFRGITDSS